MENRSTLRQAIGQRLRQASVTEERDASPGLPTRGKVGWEELL